MVTDQPQPNDNTPSSGFKKRMIVLGLFIVVVAVLHTMFGHYLDIHYLAQREAELKALQVESPWLVMGIAFVIYVVATGLSLPGAAFLTLIFGWYFGFWRALVLVSFASTTGATVAFLLSRYFFRDLVQRRFGQKLETFNQSLERDGAFYLFTLRLIPAVPFFVINAVMGLTPMRTWTYWWVSQLGMLPGTAVYVYAGSIIPDLQTIADHGAGAVFSPKQLTQILIAFALLGLFPLVVKKLVQYFRKEPTGDAH